MWLLKLFLRKPRRFDEIIIYRLRSVALINIVIALMVPVAHQLYGKYLNIQSLGLEAATVLAVASVMKMLLEKSVPALMDAVSFSNIFRYKLVSDIGLLVAVVSYLYSENIFTWAVMVSLNMQAIFVYALSMSMSNYTTFFHSKQFANFQRWRAHVIAEASIIGFTFSALLSAFSIKLNIISASLLFAGLLVYGFRMLKEFKKWDFKYMIRLRKQLARS